MSDPLKILTSQPSTDQLIASLHQLQHLPISTTPSSNLQRLRIASVLINHTLPETYSLLDQSAKNIILDLLSDRVSLSQLVSKINSDPSNQLYVNVLSDLVTSPNFAHILDHLDDQTQAYFRNIKTLLISKVYEALTQAYLKNRTETLGRITQDYFTIVFGILTNRLDRISNNDYYIKLIDSVLDQDPSIARLFFQDESIHQKLCRLYLSSKKDWHFFQILVKYLDKNLMSDEMIAPYYSTLRGLSPIIYPGRALDMASESREYPVMKLLAALAADVASDVSSLFYDQLRQAVSKFGSKGYIDGVPAAYQMAYMVFLILSASYCSKEQLNELAKDRIFLDAVSNRLESSLAVCRTVGMIFADVIYEKINGDGTSLFTIEDLQKQKKDAIHSMGQYPFIPENMEVGTAIKKIVESPKTADIVKIPEIIKGSSLKPLKQTSLDIDSDMEDSDDDEEHAKKVSIPVYLKELLAYLMADTEKDSLAAEKRKIAYAIAPQMIRAKKGSPELNYYSDSLLQEVISLSNTYNFDDFNAWKLSTMIAITVSTSDFSSCTDLLLQTFVSGDISIGIRVMILSCLSLSCRELAGGYEDDFVLGKVDIDKFGPKKLPENIHKQFIKYDRVEPIELNAITAAHSGMDGKLVRMSSTLSKERAGNKGRKIVRNTTFINKDLPKLVYSLIGLWETVRSVTGSGFKLGSFSTLLNSEYFRSLCMIYECSIPSSIELGGMTRDLLLTVTKELKYLSAQPKLDSEVFEAVLRCLKEVVEIDTNILPIKEMFPYELMAAYELLGGIFESGVIVEDKLRGNCAYVIEKLV